MASFPLVYSNPNGPFPADSEGEWPLYTIAGQDYFTLDKSIVGGDTVIGRGPFAHNCAFWREYFPTLITQTGTFYYFANIIIK